MSNAPSRKLAKRACDACKIRKVRCSGTPPCSGCVAAGIPCTSNKHHGTRGPRTLRAKTIQQIAETQGRGDQAARPVMDNVVRRSSPAYTPATATDEAVLPRSSPVPSTSSQLDATLPPLVASPPVVTPRSEIVLTPVATLVLHLCVYRLRLFPVWPIVAVADLMSALHKDAEDIEAYALANAVAAATIAQLRLNPLKNSAEVVTAESMESEVQRVRARGHRELNLSQLRIAFFLHVYHENLDPGGMKSLLHLRETITMAQMLGLHKESSYRGLSLDEQQFRKRTLWLLFITERAIAILHGLPVVLNCNTSFPVMEYDEDVSILPAFRKSVNVYWIVDKSEAFEIFQNSRLRSSSPQPTSIHDLFLLQKKLYEIPVDTGAINEVQAADICTTRTWISAVLWKLSTTLRSVPPATNPFTLGYPTQIAKDLLDVISSLPNTAIEAHGSSMELKFYEVACSVVDSISMLEMNETPATSEELNPRDVLSQLQSILLSCRGGNTTLVDQTKARLAGMQANADMFVAQEDLSSAETGSERPGETRQHGSQPNQAATFAPNAEAQHFENRAPHYGSTSVSESGNSSAADFSHIGQQQHFLPNSWDYMTEETRLEFDGDFEQNNSSAALDGFLCNTIGDSVRMMAKVQSQPPSYQRTIANLTMKWMSIRTTPGPVSQRL